MKPFEIDASLREYMPEVESRDFGELEQILLEEGIRDRLVVWKEQNKLVDGHRRYEIAQKHGLEFKVEFKSFPDEAHAKNYMDRLQISRRNLGPKKLLVASRIAEFRLAHSTSGKMGVIHEVAEELGVSDRQARRQIAAGDALRALPADIGKRFTSNEIDLSYSDIAEFASLPETDQRAVLKEYDDDTESRTFSEVLRGDESSGDDDLVEVPEVVTASNADIATSPVYPPNVSAAQKALGSFAREVDKFKDRDPDRFGTVRELIELIGDNLVNWGAE